MRRIPVDARTVRWIVAAAALFVPMLAAGLGPWRLDPLLVYLGLLPALVALSEGRRVALVTAVATPVAVGLGVLCSASAWAGTTYLVLLTCCLTWCWSRGWPGAGTYVATQAALGTISPPAGLVGSTATVATPLPDPLALGAILVGGLWVVGVGRTLLADLPVHRPEAPARGALTRFGATLAVLVGVATFVTMSWAPGLHAWWVVLSLLVIVQPDPAATTRRAVQRVLGTVVGGAGAALLVVLVGRSTGTAAIGLVLAVASAVAYLKAPYWVFAGLLTAALVLLTFPRGGLVRGEAERIGFTVVAAVAVVLLGLVWQTVAAVRGLAAARPDHRGRTGSGDG